MNASEGQNVHAVSVVPNAIKNASQSATTSIAYSMVYHMVYKLYTIVLYNLSQRYCVIQYENINLKLIHLLKLILYKTDTQFN